MLHSNIKCGTVNIRALQKLFCGFKANWLCIKIKAGFKENLFKDAWTRNSAQSNIDGRMDIPGCTNAWKPQVILYTRQ